jgi:hypothetical protein
VRVLGEAYTPEDEEDSALADVGNICIYQVRCRQCDVLCSHTKSPHNIIAVSMESATLKAHLHQFFLFAQHE